MAKAKVKSGKMPEKINAVAQYHMQMLMELHKNTQNKNSIIEAALKAIGKNFGAYLDNLARRDHSSFHHIYETGETGNESSRLFKYTIELSGAPSLTYEFTEATRPEKSGDVFRKKAFIMEDGIPLKIVPKRGKKLYFQVNGESVFANKVFVPNPGGTQVVGSFRKVLESYMENQANQLLTDIGFYDKIDKEMNSESNKTVMRIEKGSLDSDSMARASAKKIAKAVSR